MKSRILSIGIPVGMVLVAASIVGARLAARSHPPDSPGGGPVHRTGHGASPVEALDYCIQERFHDLSGFGMARMPVVPQHLYRFDPETPEEKAAVEDLRRQGWAVGLYL